MTAPLSSDSPFCPTGSSRHHARATNKALDCGQRCWPLGWRLSRGSLEGAREFDSVVDVCVAVGLIACVGPHSWVLVDHAGHVEWAEDQFALRRYGVVLGGHHSSFVKRAVAKRLVAPRLHGMANVQNRGNPMGFRPSPRRLRSVRRAGRTRDARQSAGAAQDACRRLGRRCRPWRCRRHQTRCL